MQVSLDLTSADEALETAAMALRAGVDWLEAGTPLLLAEGLRAVRRLRKEFPDVPIVADLKTMDGGYLESAMMAESGATHVVVMAQATDATIRRVVQAARNYRVAVMGDNLGCVDKTQAARRLEQLGCDYIVHHTGYDERGWAAEHGQRVSSPLDDLREVVAAVDIPVQAVGGLSVDEAVLACTMGAPIVVIGAPVTIDSQAFKTASGDIEGQLRALCNMVHALPREE